MYIFVQIVFFSISTKCKFNLSFCQLHVSGHDGPVCLNKPQISYEVAIDTASSILAHCAKWS